jgi:RNA polymerase sigma factor (sigma-70 family)
MSGNAFLVRLLCEWSEKATVVSIVIMLQKARRVLRSRGVSADDVDDLVQDAFVRLETYQREHEVVSEEAFLVRAAVNLSIDQVRRERRAPFDRSQQELPPVEDDAPGQEEIVSAREDLRRLQAGMMQLSPKSRRILLAQRYGGQSYAEIARREGVTHRAIEKNIARSVAFLMRWMAD